MSAEKIYDKVKKMLALANDAGATEGERDNALRMAYKLLAKHNLHLDDMPADSEPDPRSIQTVTICGDTWIRDLSYAIAELFFCGYYYQSTGVSGKTAHFFYGKVSNVTTAMNMADYLIKSIKREATKLYKSPTSRDGRSFGVGAASAIRQRVNKLLEDSAEVSNEAGTAVAIYNYRNQEQQENSVFLESEGVTLKMTKARSSEVSGAYHSGKNYGSKVSLANQVGGSTATSDRKMLK